MDSLTGLSLQNVEHFWEVCVADPEQYFEKKVCRPPFTHHKNLFVDMTARSLGEVYTCRSDVAKLSLPLLSLPQSLVPVKSAFVKSASSDPGPS